MDEEEKYLEQQVQQRYILRQLFRYLTRIVKWMGILLFALLLIFQIPAFQSWLVNKASDSLSKKLGTPVEVGNAYLSFFEHLTLKDVYAEDVYGDTLVFTGKLTVDFNLNPIVLYNKGLVIEELGLTDALVNIHRAEGDLHSNIDAFLQSLFPPDTTTVQQVDIDTLQKEPFSLDINFISLRNVRFHKLDEVNGNLLDILLPKGDIYFNQLNLLEKIIDIRKTEITGLTFLTESYESKPLPPSKDIQYIDNYNETGVETQTAPVDTSSFRFLVRNFRLKESKFNLHNFYHSPVKTTSDDQLDFRHLAVGDIVVSIDSFQFYKGVFSGQVNKIAALTSSGFELKSISAKKAIVGPKRTTLTGVKIVTPYSEVGDTIIFKYKKLKAFKEFVDEVRMDLRFHNSDVALRDIMVFAPKLENNNFFVNNRNTVVKLKGKAFGKINNLSARNLDIELPDGSLVAGNFDARNITERTQEYVSLRLKHFHSSIRTLRQLIPGFSPPSTFNTLRNIHFTGEFTGFFANFVAFGTLKTDIGTAKMDMKMDLLNGRDNAEYNGKLSLIDFDLGAWSKNDEFGLVNFSSLVENGSGLTEETANADLQAHIESFYFKGYNYQNANLVGKLNQNLFDGDFAIKDDNIDFSFNGAIDFTKEVPRFRFKTKVKKLDLFQLHLSKQNLSLAGNVDLNLKNNTLADLTGTAIIKDFYIKKDEAAYTIKSIVVESSIDINEKKSFVLLSEVMGGKVEGDFQIDKLPAIFIGFLANNYPGFASRINLKKPEKELENADFFFDVNIIDSKGLNWLINEKLGILKDVKLNGYYSKNSNSSGIRINAPGLNYGNISLGEIAFDFDGQDSVATISLEVENTLANDKALLPTFNFEGLLHLDSLDFGLTFAAAAPNFFDNLALKGIFYLPDSTHLGLSFDQKNLMILKSFWNIKPSNYIKFNKDEIEIHDFELTSGTKTASLRNEGQKGIKLDISNLDFHYVDEIWDYDKLDFYGNYDLNLNIQNVFELKSISAALRSDTFLINGDNYGQFQLDLFTKNLKSRVTAHMEIVKDPSSQLIVDGFYNIKAASESKKIPLEQQAKYFDLKLIVNNYPLDFARYFIAPAVKDIEGQFDIDFRVKGMAPDHEVSGQIIAKNGAFTIDYLKTRYTFDKSVVIAKNELFDATGTIIYDKFGHEALVTGGISHDHLRDLGVDALLTTDRFLALDTKKEDNSLFYGQAMGDGEVYFDGRFSQVDIYVNASVDDSTHIVMPISYDKNASELNSIRFVNKHNPNGSNNIQNNTAQSSEGVSLEMDLSIKDEAVMELVFNEKVGEIIKGQGRGNIRILVPRDDQFQMFGNYVINQGNYLFAYSMLLEINKDFRVKQGGTIHWDGDPFGAQINLAAEYKDLSVSPANFIQEYLSLAPDIEREARKRTKVDLTLLLQGDLLHPEINFDLNFPEANGQLATIIDNKLRQVKSDQNELNRQVFGLLVIGQFFPSDFAGANVVGNTINNTLEEFLSNQFSLLVNNLFSEWSEENQWLSDINFDFVYQSENQNTLADPTISQTSQDVKLSITKKFNDRLSIQVGGNVGFNEDYSIGEEKGTFIGDDIIIEYVLNKDKTLKLKFYQKLEPDISGGSRFQLGGGLSWRREFNSFDDFLKSLRKEDD